MLEIVAYIFLYISAAFYCGFDTVIKKSANEFSNDTTLQSVFHLSTNTFNFDCEALGCMSNTLKLYNENGEVIEDGWITIAAVFSEFNSTVIDNAKKVLNQCVPQVNQQLGFYASNKCQKYHIGYSLLNQCAVTKMKNGN